MVENTITLDLHAIRNPSRRFQSVQELRDVLGIALVRCQWYFADERVEEGILRRVDEMELESRNRRCLKELGSLLVVVLVSELRPGSLGVVFEALIVLTLFLVIFSPSA